MSYVLSTYSAITAILLLFTLPIGISSCSMTEYDVMSLISQNPNYKFDPCYIEWKAAQDAKVDETAYWRGQMDIIIADYNRRIDREEREQRERQRQRQRSDRKEHTNKLLTFGIMMGIIAGAIFGILHRLATRNTSNLHGESIPQTSVVASRSSTNGSQTTTDHNFTDLIVLPPSMRQQPETTAPLMPIRRDSLPSYDDSLPSYDDAIKLPKIEMH